MTARSIGSAIIAFGLVTIPVKLYSTKSEDKARKISLNMLHDPDACAAAKPVPEGVLTPPASRLKQQHMCTVCEQAVDAEHTVKGYEHATGQYVIVTPGDIESLETESTNRIEIETYVERGEVDPLYVETSYYLAPDKGAELAYDLLREALYGQSREALARYAAKGKQHIVLVRLHPTQPILVLHQLRYQHEVRDAGEVPMVGDVGELSDAARALAARLVLERAGGFEPSIYEDTSHLRMKKLIDTKIAGGEIVASSPPAAPATTLDLMTALRMSVRVQAEEPASVAQPKRTRAARASSAAKKTKPAAKKRQAIRKIAARR